MDPVKLIVFDFDGTISDSHEAAVETYNFLATKFGFKKVNAQDISLLKNKTSLEVIKFLKIPWVKLPFILKEGRVLFQDRIRSLAPFSGIQDSLSNLKKMDFELGIMTSNSRETVDRFLSTNNLNYFSFVQAEVSLFGKGKTIRKLLKTKKLNRKQVVYVGDETRDIDAAKSVGIRVVAVSWGFSSKQVLENQRPDFLAEHPQELDKIFQGLSHFVAP